MSKKALIILVVFVVVIWVGLVGSAALMVFWEHPGPPEPVTGEDPEQRRRELARAFNQPVKIDDELHRELKVLFDGLGNAARAADHGRARAYFDTERMGEEVARRIKPPPADRDRAALLRGFRDKALVGGNLAGHLEVVSWPRYEIKAVKALPDAGEVLAIVRHRSPDGPVARMRWWLCRAPRGWLVYDLESVDIGVRATTLMALPLSAGARNGRLPPWVKSLTFVAEVGKALQQGDLDRAQAALQAVDDVVFPDEVEACRWLFKGAISQQRERPEEALDFLDRAAALNPEIGMLDFWRGCAHQGLKQHDKAITCLQKYQAQLGGDSDSWYFLGVSLAALDRRDEAIDAFRKSIDDAPDAMAGSLQELGKLLPAGAKAKELAERCARLDRPEEHLHGLADEALERNDLEAVEAYISGARRRSPQHPDVAYYQARVHGLRKQIGQAAPLIRDALTRQPDPKLRETYAREFLLDARDAGQTLQGYEALPDAALAFRTLAPELLHDRNRDTLEALLKAHEKKVPGDNLLPYFRGEQHLHGGRPEEAEAAFARVDARQLDAAMRDALHSGRVLARYQAGKGLSAYADLGEKEKMFVQLAGLYAGAEDVKGLEALLAARRRDVPACPKAPLWEAEARWLAGDHAGVVKALTAGRQAVLADPAQAVRFHERLIEGLVRLGRLDEADREAEAFARASATTPGDLQVVSSGAEARGEAALLGALARGWRRAAPQDPQAAYYLGRHHELAGRPAEAIPLYQEAADRQPRGKGKGFNRWNLHSAQALAGKALEGYRAAQDPAEAFRDLAGALVRARKFNDLRALLKEHRQRQPDDGWLVYYEGELHLAEGNAERAADVFAAGLKSKSPAPGRQAFLSRRHEALVRAGKAALALAEQPGDRNVFDNLAWLCERAKDAGQLRALVAAHRKADPDDDSLPGWEVEARWLAGEHEAVVKLARAARGGKEPAVDAWRLNDRLVRSLIRLGRPREAVKEAEAIVRHQPGDRMLLVLARAAAGDVEGTREALAVALANNGRLSRFYDDPDLGPLLRSERFAALRERFPPPARRDAPAGQH